MKAYNTIFYLLEKSIKSYRRFAQARIKESQQDITIDQLLVLDRLELDPGILHADLADYVFKDSASLSRMLTLLEKNGYITREIDKDNRRRFKIQVKKKGSTVLSQLNPVITENRKVALKGIKKKDLEICAQVLKKISENSSNNY